MRNIKFGGTQMRVRKNSASYCFTGKPFHGVVEVTKQYMRHGTKQLYDGTLCVDLFMVRHEVHDNHLNCT